MRLQTLGLILGMWPIAVMLSWIVWSAGWPDGAYILGFMAALASYCAGLMLCSVNDNEAGGKHGA